jgi:glycosyltransferase involved in cell wall biosynthesis
MRILSISNCPLEESQGSGYVIINFCRGLRDRGHDVDLFGPESYEILPSLAGKAKSYRQALGMFLLARRQLRRTRYDIVEFYGGQSWLAASLLRLRRQRRFVLVSHANGLEPFFESAIETLGGEAFEGSKNKWYQLDQSKLFKHAFTSVDGLITVSKNDALYAIREGYQDAERVIPINNSLAQEYLNRDVQFERPPLIGFCGSWLENKGVNLIKKALSPVLRGNPQCQLLLVGVGNSFNKKQHFPPDVCSQIQVIPFVEDKNELRSIFGKMSILVMPSVYESFGLVATEAMACGCALVATPVGFAAELKHREEAYLMEKPGVSDLQNGIIDLLHNEQLRLTLARNGYERVQELRWESAIEKIDGIYTQWHRERIRS